MKLLAGILLLATSALAQNPNKSAITGVWEGSATVRGQQVPVRLQISGPASDLKAALLNGTEQAPASSVAFGDGHLLLNFNYYARTLEATLEDGQLSGTFGLISATSTSPRVPLTLHPAASRKTSTAGGPDIKGDWEIAVKSSKGESAWQLRVEPAGKSANVHAVIQRIDGDTGSLYGSWNGKEAKPRCSHGIDSADYGQGPLCPLRLQLPGPGWEGGFEHRSAVRWEGGHCRGGRVVVPQLPR